MAPALVFPSRLWVSTSVNRIRILEQKAKRAGDIPALSIAFLSLGLAINNIVNSPGFPLLRCSGLDTVVIQLLCYLLIAHPFTHSWLAV